MPRVLIIGATGYVGSALSSELLRSGNHTVYGLARNPAKANQLAAKEVIPVIGSVSDSSSYLSLIKSAKIHIVVDCAAAYDGSNKVLNDLIAAGKERLQEGGSKLGFVYTSGLWVHGSSPAQVSDLDPVGLTESTAKVPRMVAGWRPKLEQDILAARDILDVMILRPAQTYGRESTFWSPYFGAILEAARGGQDSVQIPFEATSMPALIHVDDLASGYRCALEKLPLISGTSVYPVFDLVTSYEAMASILRAAALVLRFQGAIVMKNDESDALAEAMQTSINGDSSRAKQLLGWQPSGNGFVSGMAVYAAAWLANQPSK